VPSRPTSSCVCSFSFVYRPLNVADLVPLTVVTIPSSSSSYETSYINFVRLIQRYIKPFAKADPQNALQYIYLICLSADLSPPTGKEQVDACHEMIRDLVMESGRIAELLGDIKPDGTKIVGHLSLP
jgi:nuclear pore complex protein Nup93